MRVKPFGHNNLLCSHIYISLYHILICVCLYVVSHKCTLMIFSHFQNVGNGILKCIFVKDFYSRSHINGKRNRTQDVIKFMLSLLIYIHNFVSFYRFYLKIQMRGTHTSINIIKYIFIRHAVLKCPLKFASFSFSRFFQLISARKKINVN